MKVIKWTWKIIANCYYLDVSEKSTSPAILFRVRSPTPTYKRVGDTFVYSKILDNMGGAYSKTDGVFTAPVIGRYIFNVQMCTTHRMPVMYAFAVDGSPVSRSYYSEKQYSLTMTTCSMSDVYLSLSAGAKVSVQSTSAMSGRTLKEDDYRWNTFSGLLV